MLAVALLVTILQTLVLVVEAHLRLAQAVVIKAMVMEARVLPRLSQALL
jgi:hypothetical protein